MMLTLNVLGINSSSKVIIYSNFIYINNFIGLLSIQLKLSRTTDVLVQLLRLYRLI